MMCHSAHSIALVRPRSTGVARCAVLAGCMALLMGCATAMAPKVEETLAPMDRFGGDGEAPLTQCAALGGEPLQSLIASAFSDSPTLAQSWARLRQARSAARAQGATVLPSLSLSGEYVDSATSGGNVNPGGAQQPGNFGPIPNGEGGTWQSTVAARYELDFWGRLDSRRDAAQFSAQAAEADLRTAALSLSADIAAAWAEWVTAVQRVATLQHQFDDAQVLARLQAMRFGRGQSDALALAQARQQAAALEAQLAEAGGVEDRARLRLHLLLGRTPDEGALPTAPETLPSPTALPAAGLPSALLERRPDLRSAWLRLRAADAQAAAAAAERWPRLTLSANVFTQTTQFSTLFDETLRQIAARLDWNLFEGGALKARQDEAEAVAVERLFALEQAWLQALSEVQSALDGERATQQRLNALGVRRAHAEERLVQARRRYAQGQLPYLEVLSAQQSLNSAELDVLAARNARFTQRVNLCRGLAASVADPLPTPAPLRAAHEESP